MILVADAHAASIAAKPNEKSDAYKAAISSVNETLKAFEPLELGRLPAAVQQTLVWMRTRRDAAVQKDPSLAPSAEMAHDLRLLRFLIGQKWDAAKAADEYVSVLKQRRDLKLDALRARMVAANAAFFAHGGDALDEVHFHPASAGAARRMPRLWVDTSSAAGPYPLLRHRAGHLLVCEYAPDFARISAVGEAGWHEAELAFTELQQLVLDELSARTGVLIGVCKVTDVLNRESALASSLNPVNPWATKGEKQFKATGGLLKTLYPTVVYKWLMVNLAKSWKAKVKWAIDNFGGRSAYKMFVFDADYKQALAAEAAPAVLPAQLGGSLPAATFAAD